MKYRLKCNKQHIVQSCIVDGDKGGELVYADAETLRTGGLGSLIPLVYEQHRKVWRFIYAAEGLVPLDMLLRDALAPRSFEYMLRSFLDVLHDCENNDLLRQRISTDPHYIFFDPTFRCLRFLYVPLHSYVSSADGMKGALVYFCEHAAVPRSEAELRDRVLDIARRMVVVTSTGFSGQLEHLGVERAQAPGDANGADAWLDTDQLGNRTAFGMDFVSAQNNASPWLFVRESLDVAWQLDGGAYGIGRDGACAISLPDVCGLSWHHAQVEINGAACSVTDLRSTNGTWVNGGRIEPGVPFSLNRGDRIMLGTEFFRLA